MVHSGWLLPRETSLLMRGVISPVPDITLLGGGQGDVARLVAAGTPALATVTVTAAIIGISLVSGDDFIMIEGNWQGPGGALGADNGNCKFGFNEVINDDVNIDD